MNKLKKLLVCMFSFSCAKKENYKHNASIGSEMVEDSSAVEVKNIKDTIQRLTEDYNISAQYLLVSSNARTPAVLRFSFKRAYQNLGMSDKNNELTPFGHSVFQHLDDEHAKTGKPKPVDLPKVVTSLSYD